MPPSSSASSPPLSARCPICLSTPTVPVTLPCTHAFCYECLTTHLHTRPTCPTCHRYVSLDSLPTPSVPAPAATPDTPRTPPPPIHQHQHQQQQQQHQQHHHPPRTPSPTLHSTLSRAPAHPPPLPAHPPRHPAPQSPASRSARLTRAEARARATLRADAGYTSAYTPASPSLLSPPPRTRPAPAPAPTPSAAALFPGTTTSTAAAALGAAAAGSSRAGAGRAAGGGSGSGSGSGAAPAAASRGRGVLDSPPSPTPSSAADLLANADRLSAKQLAGVIASLSQKLQQKNHSDRAVENHLLQHFLRHTHSEKQAIVAQMRAQLDMLSADLAAAEAAAPPRQQQQQNPVAAALAAAMPPDLAGALRRSAPLPPDNPVLVRKRQRLMDNHDVLQTHYFETVARHTGDARKRALRKFTDDIFKLTQYSRLRDRATLVHVARVPDAPCNDVFKASNIVSSMEFDRDLEFLATAGVTKRIKIFEFSNVSRNLSDLHYPIREIPTVAKLSWVCWNPYIRHHLISSDYEGVVKLWDVNLSATLSDFEEHDSRAWSVDYCPTKPTCFASGSDDGTVKLWTSAQRNSVMTLDNRRANVCSVKFHPTQAHMLAYGSVDNKVHYYDLRNPCEALQVFKSHSRAVSYVKFMSDTELVSASVDSTIKLWDLQTQQLARTFTGHMNDRNFVGLSVTGDYIACGSEENAVYCYYKSIPPPITDYRFSSVDPLTGEEMQDDDESQFVSSVCWNPGDSTMLVAANSLGAMKVLSLDAGNDSDEDDSARIDSRDSDLDRDRMDEFSKGGSAGTMYGRSIPTRSMNGRSGASTRSEGR